MGDDAVPAEMSCLRSTVWIGGTANGGGFRMFVGERFGLDLGGVRLPVTQQWMAPEIDGDAVQVVEDGPFPDGTSPVLLAVRPGAASVHATSTDGARFRLSFRVDDRAGATAGDQRGR